MKKLLLIFFLVISSGCRPGELSVHFIDVGLGHSTFIKFPDGRNMLIDGGDAYAGIKVVEYLKKIGVKNIDTIVATHPHPDHIDGLLKVIREFEIGVVLTNKEMSGCVHYKNLYEAVKEAEIEFRRIKKGDVIEPFVEILHPETLTGNLNSDSMVMMLTYKDIKVLFTADICPVVSDNLAEYYGEKLKSDILQIPHSGQSGSESFFRMVSPDIAVQSIGDGKWRRPLREEKILKILNELNIPVLSTEIDGTIVLKTNGEKWWK